VNFGMYDGGCNNVMYWNQGKKNGCSKFDEGENGKI